jgi:hypothetical protein
LMISRTIDKPRPLPLPPAQYTTLDTRIDNENAHCR